MKKSGEAILKYGDLVMFSGFGWLVVGYGQRGLRWEIGLVVAAVGFVFWAVARLQLGKSFAVTAQAKDLVTTGIYSKIRHPVYIFGGLGYLGLFIAWGNWILTIVFVALQSMQIRRMRKEEKVLEEAFGDEYRQYKARTWL
ncbi:MAG TPA: isoprenylcysteine carboxylmethyltransferase family protein [Verrucomicrobiae bacterium]|nr:isoprenylcysteine carboxylmethyltransferase family protein [Verrucomicrobiae bacterium]